MSKEVARRGRVLGIFASTLGTINSFANSGSVEEGSALLGITRHRKSDIAFVRMCRLISASRILWRILTHSSCGWCFFVCCCYVFALARRRATSFVPPMLVICWDEVHLTLHVSLGLKIMLAIVGSMAPSKRSRNPPRCTMSRFLTECYVPVSDVAKRVLVFFLTCGCYNVIILHYHSHTFAYTVREFLVTISYVGIT